MTGPMCWLDSEGNTMVESVVVERWSCRTFAPVERIRGQGWPVVAGPSAFKKLQLSQELARAVAVVRQVEKQPPVYRRQIALQRLLQGGDGGTEKRARSTRREPRTL